MVPLRGVARVADWRGIEMHAWVDKFETNLAHSHASYTKHKPELILRQTIDGEIREYADGLDHIIADIIRFGRGTPAAIQTFATLPHDAIVQLFPGGALPETGVDSLIEVPGVWQPTVPDDMLGPGSMVICRPPLTMSIGGTTTRVPFSLGMAIPGSDADDSDYILAAWWVPSASPAATLRPGKKAKVIDLFGPWVQYDEQNLETAAYVTVPCVKVQRADVLLVNVHLEDNSQIPFQVFDVLRTEWNIDVSAISLSLTHRGNIYRAHVLQTAGV